MGKVKLLLDVIGDFEALAMLYEDIPDTLSQLIRTAFVPQDGRKFIVADFSAIEARVIAWIAEERWRLRVFEGGGDIYCASASQMFHVPVEKHGVNGHERGNRIRGQKQNETPRLNIVTYDRLVDNVRMLVNGF